MYHDFRTFIRNPEYIYLDCHTMGNRCEPKFWMDLLPFVFPGRSDGWLSDDVSFTLYLINLFYNIPNNNVIKMYSSISMRGWSC